jgi:hypothetical protein
LVQQILHVFDEEPGLRLTPAEAQRLWCLDGATCGTVLKALLNSGMLQLTPDGRLVRRPPVR